MPKLSVFIAEPFPEAACAVIRDIAEVRLGVADRAYTEEELSREVRDVHGLVVTSRDCVTARVIEAAPRLRVITKSGARPVNVDVEAARQRGIAVTWTPGANAVSVAEHTLALMLAAMRRLPVLTARLRGGGWRDLSILGTELQGKTIGLIGLGSVGRQVVRKLRGFDVRILAHDPFIPSPKLAELGVTPTPLETLLREADVVSIHCELTNLTRHLIGAPELERMKPTAFLVNTARGAIVDEAALDAALSARRIAGAALDVFETEPASAANRLLALDNVVATPHTAAYTAEALARETTWALEDVRAILLGRPPIHWTPAD